MYKRQLLETLRYADEVREGQKFFGSIGDDKPEEELLDLAETLIEKKTAPFDASEFEDRYAEALHELIEKKAKAKGNKTIIEEDDEPSGSGSGNVIDLMAALKKSVGKEQPKKTTRRKKSA